MCVTREAKNDQVSEIGISSRYNMKLVGVWRSLVAHLVWDQGVQGSNPCTPTKKLKKAHIVGFFS